MVKTFSNSTGMGQHVMNVILAVQVDGAMLHPLNVKAEAVNVYALGIVNSS